MTAKHIRIKDIARLAGVSAGTVDRVLHNRGKVSEKALQKVKKVMDEIEYEPNVIARTLGSNKKYRIAALVPDPESDPYWEQTGQGVMQAQTEWAHYRVTIDSYLFDQYNKESFKKKAHEALLTNPDGIVTAPIFYDEALLAFRLLRNGEIPFVLFNTYIPELQPLSFIGQDSFHSGQVGAELMHLGQREGGKLAVLNIDEDVHNSLHLLEKERGFREYFKERNRFQFDIIEFNTSPNDADFRNQFAALMDQEGLRGIFVTTSKGTSVVASLLERQGRKDIRLIGYDMLEENLKYLRSGTIDFLINQNPKRQAFLGISHLVNYLMFKKKAPATDLFPLEIITRQNLESYLGSRIH